MDATTLVLCVALMVGVGLLQFVFLVAIHFQLSQFRIMQFAYLKDRDEKERREQAAHLAKLEAKVAAAPAAQPAPTSLSQPPTTKW